MPKNAVRTAPDGRKRYRYTKSDGKPGELKQRQKETVTDFKKRCDKADVAAELGSKESAGVTFDDLFEMYNRIYLRGGFVSISYRDSQALLYKTHVKKVFGHLSLTRITRQEVYLFLTQKITSGYKKKSVDKMRLVISAPYRWAADNLGWDITSPTTGIVIKKPRQQAEEDEDEGAIKVISEEEKTRFMTAAKQTKYLNYFKVMQMTGLRPSEAAGLKKTDIKEGVLQIRRGVTIKELSKLKTKAARRDIPSYPALQTVLDDQIRLYPETTWLFPSANGKPSLEAINNAFKRTKERTAVWIKIKRRYHGELITSPVDFTLYNFRHTFATEASRQLTPKQLAYIMGHADIQTTLKYYVGMGAKDKSDTIDGMEKLFAEKTGQKTGQKV